MNKTPSTSCAETLLKIVARESIHTSLHPVVSLKSRRMVGFEALSRGYDPDGGEILPPAPLFETARRLGISRELDRICRRQAVAAYMASPCAGDHILFVNFDPAVLDSASISDLWTEKMVRSLHAEPSSIAIEIVESRVSSYENLIAFAGAYRERGFLVVLDDFGAEHSNLDRICHVRPDIIKIDRRLVSGVARDYYKQSVIGSIIDLARKIGSLALAEGVEDIEDIITCYELGADLFQGFYFTRPVADIAAVSATLASKTAAAATALNDHLSETISRQQEQQKSYDSIIERIVGSLAGTPRDGYDALLAVIAGQFDVIECAYILDGGGVQISNTIFRQPHSTPRPALFQPARKGTDHALKSYFYYIRDLNLKRYFTDPYISLASGHICRTMSATFESRDNGRAILCVDFTV